MNRDTETGTTWLRQQSAKCSEGLQYVVRQTRIMSLAVRHPAVPWPAKVVAACSVAYLFSPLQLIPSFIPIIGQLDDVAVIYAGMKLLRILTPRLALEECEAWADAPSSIPSAHPSLACRQEPAL